MPIENATCHYGLLSGEIVKGDYDKVVAFLKSNYPFLDNFGLRSPGGNVDEAIRIGRLFRRLLVDTGSMNDGPCASACALIWFAGVERAGKVGIHRPQINDPMFRGLSPADASSVYRQVLERITAYLDEMEVPKAIIGLMIDTSSSDIRWVNAEDALDRPPSLAEWEDASCGPSDSASAENMSASELDAAIRRIAKHMICKMVLLDNRRDRLEPP